MEKSSELNELGAALAKAQAEIRDAAKTAQNPHLGNKYATLENVWDACRDALTKHGLSVLQFAEDDQPGTLHMSTMLLHSSGQWIKGTSVIPLQKQDAQSYGSASTYARRYGLCAMVGIVADGDDDGHAASDRGGNRNQGRQQPRETPREQNTPRPQAQAPSRPAGAPQRPLPGGEAPAALCSECNAPEGKPHRWSCTKGGGGNAMRSGL
jgi:hypothetical protein